MRGVSFRGRNPWKPVGALPPLTPFPLPQYVWLLVFSGLRLTDLAR
jgi:hypothetical protein